MNKTLARQNLLTQALMVAGGLSAIELAKMANADLAPGEEPMDLTEMESIQANTEKAFDDAVANYMLAVSVETFQELAERVQGLAKNAAPDEKPFELPNPFAGIGWPKR